MSTQEQIPQARERRSGEKRHPSPLLAYLVALFAVAFALLLLSYFMQQKRSDQELISGLQENVSAMQTVSTVLERNEALEKENAELREKAEALETAEARAEKAEKTALALDYLWRIQRDYARKRYSSARELIGAFEEAGLAPYLPDESLIDPEYRSPAEQYRSIYDALF